MLYDGGDPPASPAPTMTLDSASCVKFVAKPQTMVNRLQIPQAAAMIETRRYRSDNQATGRPQVV